MKKILIAAPFLFCSIILVAQDYNVSLIPDSLKINVHAVKRFEELKIEIKSPSKAVIKHKWAITILNEEGTRHSWYQNSYDKLQSLEDISGKLYDASGKHIRSIKKKEIADLSVDDNMSLMTDSRVKQFNFYHKLYPYTVEFEDEQTLHGMFFLPTWFPVESLDFSVQHSQLIVQAPEDYNVRYKNISFSQQPVTTTSKGDKVLSWTLTNFKGLAYEPFQPILSEALPNIKLAPSDFELQGYKGNMTTWQNLGKFIAQLNYGRDELPANIKTDIQNLTAGVSSAEEKIKLIYNYLQKNTRYISIQLGIGGWQPFDASYVASKRYGDCKALSNYTIAMLKAAGIKSNYVLITAGEGRKGLFDDFPSSNFNHAIICVPNGQDTIWLECTSQTKSPGFMGTFTGNRKALMITDDGGVVVKTPSYSVENNLQLRRVDATIDEQGNLTAQVKTRFTGEQQELQHELIHSFNAEQREKYLNAEISLPTYKVEYSDYKEHKGRIPVIDEELKITSPLYATITGKRLFVVPNLFSKTSIKLSADKPRKFPIEFLSSFRDVDTMVISIPSGYHEEAIPKSINLSNKFGKYSISFKFKASGNIIEVLRLFERYHGHYSPEDYIELVKFYEEIYKADRGKIVLVKKD
jgi:hypothetical protein